MIYLVKRVDFDEMENHDPLSKTVVGYALSEKEAALAIAKLDRQTPKRTTGYSFDRREFPHFEIEHVQRLP